MVCRLATWHADVNLFHPSSPCSVTVGMDTHTPARHPTFMRVVGQAHDACRTKHFSPRMEETHVGWIVRNHRDRTGAWIHPRRMTSIKVEVTRPRKPVRIGCQLSCSLNNAPATGTSVRRAIGLLELRRMRAPASNVVLNRRAFQILVRSVESLGTLRLRLMEGIAAGFESLEVTSCRGVRPEPSLCPPGGTTLELLVRRFCPQLYPQK